MKKIILYIILSSSLLSNGYFVYENNYLKQENKHLEQENEKLKETPEIYWQNAIEKFNNKNYTETKEILNNLIEKFPTSSLVKTSQDKIKEINLIEKKKKEEEQRIIKSLPKQITNAKNAIAAEKILDDLDNKYDDSYSELKNIIKKERDKVREKEGKRIIASLPKKIKNSKSALDAEKMLEDIGAKYGSYPGVQQSIEGEKNKIKEKIEKEKEEQKYIEKAEQIVNAIRNKKYEIMNGDTTMYEVITKTIGKPVQTLSYNLVYDYEVLIYGKTIKEGRLALGQRNTVPFRIELPLINYNMPTPIPWGHFMEHYENIYEYWFEEQISWLKIYTFNKEIKIKKGRK